MNLREKARQLPQRPGAYIMKDGYGNIIYVGKAKNLKNRVSQYFQSSDRHAPKIIRMIENIEAFDYIRADTELEALLLECRLIKDLKPMYNSQLKNDRGYVYIKLMDNSRFPVFEIIEERAEDGICYGPYTSEKSVERALAALQDNFKLRHCKSFAPKKSGCLNCQLGLCLAPCTEEVDAELYMERIKEAVSFLEGRNLELITRLENRMQAAAEALDFNKAVKHRDDIKALKRLISRQMAVGFTQRNRSIAAIERIDTSTAKLFLMQGSRIVYKTKLELDADCKELQQGIADLILKHARDYEDGAAELDKHEVDQAHIVYSYLKNKKDCSYLLIPKSWFKRNNICKLEQGVEKLIGKTLYN